MRPHRTITGTLHYTSRKPDRDGQERGRESFMITVHGDGRRTLRAHCEINDAPNVMRDVVLTLDKNWVTRDAFVRLSVGDETFGSSWFRFADTFAECEGWTHERGRISERIEYDAPSVIFGTHPIQGDGFNLHWVDVAAGPARYTMDRFLMCSLDHRGATGPSLVWHPEGFPVEFVGECQIDVAAGRFDAWHFCFGERGSTRPGSNEANEHPPYEVWTTADGDYVVLKAKVDGYMMTHYELTELVIDEGDE